MMKKLSLFEKFLFFINTIVGLVLLLIVVIPFFDPERFPWINISSLFYPLFLGFNLVFLIMWLIKLKPHFLFSTLIIGIGYQQIAAFFPMNKKEVLKQSDIKLLSYNVKRFNIGLWINSPTVQNDLFEFINKQNAGVVCIQEFVHLKDKKIDLPFKHYKAKGGNGIAIYSKYPMVSKGSLQLKNTVNSIIYVDIKTPKEIIRIYNAHFESFGLKTNQHHFGDKDNKTLLKHFKRVFVKQSEQIKLLKKHIDTSPHRSIVVGDFNNTAFSWNYNYLLQNRKDAFVEAGSGFGTTYNYFYPLRIDFILPDETMNVGSFTNYNVKLSDHFPIMARIDLNN